MNSLFSSVARTFSADLRAERHHASISIPSVPGSFSESHAGSDIQGLEQGSMTHAEQRRSAELRSQSLPTRFEAPHPLQTVGSVAGGLLNLDAGPRALVSLPLGSATHLRRCVVHQSPQ
jgi:hypothetical protein